jgi:hypothetical protein
MHRYPKDDDHERLVVSKLVVRKLSVLVGW